MSYDRNRYATRGRKPQRADGLLMNDRLTCMLPEIDKIRFIEYCDRRETTPSIQLRKFIQEKIEEMETGAPQ